MANAGIIVAQHSLDPKPVLFKLTDRTTRGPAVVRLKVGSVTLQHVARQSTCVNNVVSASRT